MRKVSISPINLLDGLSVNSFTAQLAATLSRVVTLEMKALPMSAAYWLYSLHRTCKLMARWVV
jgi:hypothetical protein